MDTVMGELANMEVRYIVQMDVLGDSVILRPHPHAKN
jgi:hypothetical protein